MVTVLTLSTYLELFTWSFPLLILTYLAYYLESQTRFKTRWRWFLIATVLSTVHPIVSLRDYARYGQPLIQHNLVINTLLLSAFLLAAYASLPLLKFQNISLGKTRKTIKLLLVLSLLSAVYAYASDGLRVSTVFSLFLYNTSISLMVFIYLVIGKLARKYIPRLGSLAYAIARAGSVVMVLDAVILNRAYMLSLSARQMQLHQFAANTSHFSATLLLFATTILLINEARIRGLHITPSNDKIGGVIAEYRLKSGRSYILSGSGKKAVSILVDYVANNHDGFCMTRTPPEELRETHGLRTLPMMWLTNARTDEKSLKPTDLPRMKAVVGDFIDSSKKPVILIERLDYLIAQNDFTGVLRFLQDLNDLVMAGDAILIVSIDSTTLSAEQFNLIKQELHLIGADDKITMPDHLYKVLEFVYNENKLNRNPSYKEVGAKLGITKTTVRNRIHELDRRGLLRVETQGRYKLLELTERGRTIIMAAVLKPEGGVIK